MGVIKVLDKNLSNMIAAGEVVERPASVVKELVENSIDSLACNITVEIKNGGKTYIRVTDDGLGMSTDDARLAFTRHATSKISSEADLFNIHTMGFRGEALAAIASVSRVTMLTSDSSDSFGTELIIEGGEEISCKEVGVARGTTVIVENLFYNTPARMSFMKKDSTENANILSLIQRYAISEGTISFKLIIDGRVSLSVDSGLDLKDSIYATLGSEISDSLLKAERLTESVCVSGYVGAPRCSRSNRNYQILFVNRRIVKSKTVTAAIDRAYHNLLMNGKYAVSILMINVPDDRVDVNVHPTKSEIRFFDEKQVFDTVYYAIKDALDSEDQINHTVTEFFSGEKVTGADDGKYHQTIEDLKKEMETNVYAQTLGKMSFFEDKPEERPIITAPVVGSKSMLRDNGFYSRKDNVHLDELSEKFCPQQADDSYLFKAEIPYRYVGELFKTYIIIESGNSFYLVDKHAAHERILFNKIYDKYIDGERYSQRLLAGVPVSLSPEEADIAKNNREKLSKLGYEFDEFGQTDVLLRTVPYVITQGDTVSSFTEIIQIIGEDKGIEMTELENKALKTIACKAAIKAGYDSTDEELEKFIKKLLFDGNINYCPHGRPIICEYTRESVEKAFKRIV